LAYRSPDWHVGDEGKDYISASFRLKSDTGQPLAEVILQHELSLFNQRLTASRNQLMLLTGVVTLIMLGLMLWVLHSSTVNPIRQIISQLNKVRNDRHQLGKPVGLSGNAELRELVQVFNEMSQELAKSYDKYETLAFTDTLTNLPNRTLFLDRLSQIVLLSQRKGEKFGVMLLDLDGFKDINDTLGHHIGDELLKQIAERLQRIIRASSTIARVVDNNAVSKAENITPGLEESTIARLGGDEFAILLPNLASIEGAVSVVKRITEVLEESVLIDDNAIVVAGTLGVSMFPEHGENAETLLRRADVALYVAKHLKNDFSVYDPVYDNNSVKQLALKAELRSAIDEGQMVLFYQPKLDLARGCVDSVEALIRWQHPERGMIPPDQFIPLSEQRGLIGPLTDWVIQRALRQHKEWQQQGVIVQIAVNLSSRILYDLSLPNKIGDYLAELQLPPSALSLEITEEATMIDPERALTILNDLRSMDVSLSIDDFGTGHSSLSYLKRLPVDEIK
ncbi:MAG TPA: EAL domain-containing protein, partial [Candidatus Tenderia electrophaga]|nr:EAL domain-containing protein [Candidatus Tenderia electrophaga]